MKRKEKNAKKRGQELIIMYQGQGFEEQNVTWLVILQKLWETLKPKK